VIRIEKNPSQRQLAVFGLLWLVFFGIMGASFWRRGSYVDAGVCLALGVLIPLAGWVWPEFLRMVYLFAVYSTLPIGLVVSYVILLVIYYLVVTPIGLVMRLFGYDPLQRRFDRAARSYWTPRRPQGESERYFQQF
jgi:hypothetical protein